MSPRGVRLWSDRYVIGTPELGVPAGTDMAIGDTARGGFPGRDGSGGRRAVA